MSNDSLHLSPLGLGQHRADPAGMLRAQQARVGTWMAIAWQRLLLGAIVLEIPLQLDKYFFRDFDDAALGAISGFNISLTTICLVFLYLQWLPRLVVESNPIRISKTLTAYVGITALSVLWAADRNRTVFDVFLIAQAYLVFTYVVNHIKTRTDVMLVMTLLMAGMFVQSVMMTGTWITGDDINIGPIEFMIYADTLRATGTMGSPNVAASYLALLLAPSLCLLFLSVDKRLKLLAWCALMSASVALVLTLSRGGWVAAAISMAIFIAVAFRKRWISPVVFTSLLVTVALIAVWFLPTLAERLLGDDNGSAAARLPLNEISKIMILENPLGVGANNWDVVAQRHAETSRFREEWFFFAHNKYLLVLAEIGWLGFFSFVAFLLSIVACGTRAVRHTNQPLSPLVLALTAAFFGQFIHMSFDVFNSRVQVQMICLISGLIVALAHMLQTAEDERELVLQQTREGQGKAVIG